MKQIFIYLCLISLSACSLPSTERDIQTAIANTVEARPINTVISTNIPYPTYTPLFTYTPFPTHTPNPTHTLYPTYTPYPTPKPIIVTATYSPTPKFTPTNTSSPTISPTPTKTSTFTPTPNATQTQQAIINATKGADATATKIAQKARATEIAQYEKIEYKELITYPDSYKGEKVWIQGRIFNINSNTELQMYLGWTYDAVYVVMRSPFSGIYEDDWIVVYGEVYGEHCGTNVYGAEICQPLLIDAFFVKQ